MKILNPFLIVASLFLHVSAFSQFTESITSSRPGASFTPYTDGKGILQLQTGFVYETEKDNSTSYSRRGLSYSLLIRYGVSESFELRSSIVTRKDEETVAGLENTSEGLALWDIGFRWNVIDGTSSGTSLGFQTEFRINRVGSDAYQIDELGPRTIALFTTPVTDWLTFTTNLGVSWYDIAGSPNGLYTINFGFPISSKIGGFVEMFGTFTSDVLGKSFNTGIGYLANKNLLLDFSLGFADRIQSNFFDLGVSWRLSTKK